MIDSKREFGTIVHVSSGKEDHDILTCSIGIEFDSCGYQGFGNLCLDEELLPLFVKDLCNTFGVSELQDLVGKKCYALRCFGSVNESIEGLETEDGKRFVITSWRKKYFCDVKSPLEYKIEHLTHQINSSLRRVSDFKQQLKSIKKDYTNWE